MAHSGDFGRTRLLLDEKFTFTNRLVVGLMNGFWFILGGGVVSALLWLLAGCLLALTVVGIPFAVASFRIVRFAAFPFGRRLVEAEAIGETQVPGTLLANILWVLLAGFWLALAHIVAGIGYCVSIVGIPFGFAHFRLALVCFAPLGKRTVPTLV
jgi:uncharacterized membrane protein YccF (DUF307 family)